MWRARTNSPSPFACVSSRMFVAVPSPSHPTTVTPTARRFGRYQSRRVVSGGATNKSATCSGVHQAHRKAVGGFRARPDAQRGVPALVSGAAASNAPQRGAHHILFTDRLGRPMRLCYCDVANHLCPARLNLPSSSAEGDAFTDPIGRQQSGPEELALLRPGRGEVRAIPGSLPGPIPQPRGKSVRPATCPYRRRQSATGWSPHRGSPGCRSAGQWC